MASKSPTVIAKAKASPTKAFFVRMLTRDISLDDCILDLVDNSIDGAWEASGKHPSEFVVNKDLSKFKIDIRFSQSQFQIVDNCGGITLDDAANYAFTFGRTKDQPEADYSVGVYGIGMKRAAFKIGSSITIRSSYLEGKKLQGFQVPINVKAWMEHESQDWDFDIDEYDPAPNPGVDIVIKELSEETKNRFKDPTYERNLVRVLTRDYMVPLMRGLAISINGTKIKTGYLELLQDEQFIPMRDTYMDGDVKVELIAGMRQKPPDSNEPEEGNKRTDEVSGWYVICNGRVVLGVDRSTITGWGLDGLPMWHQQYSGFVGIAFFSSKKSELLPMTTTKRSVDVSSGAYRRALSKMQVPTRAWIDYTNKRKTDQEVKSLETSATAREISTLPKSPQVRLPQPSGDVPGEKVANVLYTVPLKRLRKLGVAFGSRYLSYKDVGQKSFEYAYDKLVDEEDA
jgi:histidine kinase/DNA gyrase B/HSP90-like ATPase